MTHRTATIMHRPVADLDVLLDVTFEPLLDESVRVVLHDPGLGTDRRGCTNLGYRLYWSRNGETSLVFDGADFHGSPMYADDSPDTLVALLGFLTLREHDVEDSYWTDHEYGPLQLEWRDSYCCESLGAEIACIGDGEYALPNYEAACHEANVEIFEMSDSEVEEAWRHNDGEFWCDDDGGPLDGGWYFWTCLPGCLPGSDPYGPYETRREAVEDAYDTFDLWDRD